MEYINKTFIFLFFKNIFFISLTYINILVSKRLFLVREKRNFLKSILPSSEAFSLWSVFSLPCKVNAHSKGFVNFIEGHFVLLISSHKSHNEHSRNKTLKEEKVAGGDENKFSCSIRQKSSSKITQWAFHCVTMAAFVPTGKLSGNYKNALWTKITSLPSSLYCL